ncbi:MAG: phosphatase PAP2 family protein [Chitinophagaceae bacterium]|nr:phosphatase PAP2 family protein [Chitinophagaceae bacterium]
MKRIVTAVLCLLFFAIQSFSQSDSLVIAAVPVGIPPAPVSSKSPDYLYKSKVYNMHPKYQLPLAAAAVVGSSMAFKALDENARLTPSDALKLNPNDINSFDRPTALRNPSGFPAAASAGDFFLNFSVASPVLLALDKHTRKDWVDLLTLYMASQAFDNMLYFGAILAVRRPRPLAYNPYLDSVARSGVGMTKSFFSGHVSFSATATFFAVKVFTDYHDIKGWPRIGLYTLAAIPPLLTGYFRIQSGRHFKTDVIVGMIAGSTSGILVPELFKRKARDARVSFAPYYVPQGGGLSLGVSLAPKDKPLRSQLVINN